MVGVHTRTYAAAAEVSSSCRHLSAALSQQLTSCWNLCCQDGFDETADDNGHGDGGLGYGGDHFCYLLLSGPLGR